MTRRLILDANPLSRICHPKPAGDPENAGLIAWLATRARAGDEILVSELTDYEVRRELLRAGKTRSLQILDGLKARVRYVLIDSATMLRAAELWAQSRKTGHVTADPKELDCDVILAAHAEREGAVVVTETWGIWCTSSRPTTGGTPASPARERGLRMAC